jgi:hypothetical protein
MYEYVQVHTNLPDPVQGYRIPDDSEENPSRFELGLKLNPPKNIWNLATPDIDVYVDIEDHNIDVYFDIEYSNLDIDVTVFDIVVTKKR